jgi:hypothetical protein
MNISKAPSETAAAKKATSIEQPDAASRNLI